MSKTNIYILRLKGGKFYIGKSDNIMIRYKEHLEGTGSSWTKLHKPIAIEKIVENTSNFDEDKYTKEYMAKYGIDNVRGGTYVSTILDDFQIETLNREIWGAQNKCTRCGRPGHFVKDCFANSTINSEVFDSESDSEIVWCCEYCDYEFETERACASHEIKCKNKQKNNSKNFTKF